MSKIWKLGVAFLFAAVVAATMGRTVEAAGTPGYCRVLPTAIANATAAGLTDLAASLQAIYDANCQ